MKNVSILCVLIFGLVINACGMNTKQQYLTLDFGYEAKNTWISKHELVNLEILLKDTTELYVSHQCLLDGYKNLSKKQINSYTLSNSKMPENTIKRTKSAMYLGAIYQRVVKQFEKEKFKLTDLLNNFFTYDDSKDDKSYIGINIFPDLNEKIEEVRVPLNLEKFTKLEKVKITIAPWYNENDIENVEKLFKHLFAFPYTWCKNSKYYVDYKTITTVLVALVDRNTQGEKELQDNINNKQ